MTTRTHYYLILLLMLIWNSAVGASGVSVYEKNCNACHGQGVAGAPKLGDVNAWKGRLTKGIDEMVISVIQGVQGYSGAMPPRGGNPDLTDAEIRESVQYMLGQLQ